MGAVLGLLLGVGLLLVWSSFWAPGPPRTARPSRLRPLLSSAGLGEVTVASFLVVCAVCAAIATAFVLVASRTVPVALVFGVMGGYLPVAVVKGRAQRRQREFAEVWPEAVDNLASAVRAGMSLPEALSALAVRGPEPLREAFRGFALDYQVSGRFAECPGPAQGPALRPGGGPRRGEPAGGARGGRRRPRPAPAQPVGLPA